MKSALQSGTHIIICDGAKALILRNDGDRMHPNLKTIKALTQEAPPTRDMGNDRPGRVFESAGDARSSAEQTDWHDVAETEFLKSVADEMRQIAAADPKVQFILAAPPRALGQLRDMLPAAVQGRVSAEIAKDLVKMPVPEIENYLSTWFSKD